MLHLNCKSGGEGEVWVCGVRHYNVGPNENEWACRLLFLHFGGGGGKGGWGGSKNN